MILYDSQSPEKFFCYYQRVRIKLIRGHSRSKIHEKVYLWQNKIKWSLQRPHQRRS